MIFQLDKNQQQKLNEWLAVQYQEIGEEQLKVNEEHPGTYPFVARGEDDKINPYFGAIGGELTYAFSPTGLGDICVVTLCKGTKWERKINLTDFDNW